MEPKPFVALNHLTVPTAIAARPYGKLSGGRYGRTLDRLQPRTGRTEPRPQSGVGRRATAGGWKAGGGVLGCQCLFPLGFVRKQSERSDISPVRGSSR